MSRGYERDGLVSECIYWLTGRAIDVAEWVTTRAHARKESSARMSRKA